ncbi:pentapeptide repeat-containing protein [Tepidicaulis sp. LMO-SS28]|uniref:pentapeptide repeat-containing protein n=1 Tax=Tepidicaulis sp. LMO-SS28 TaxID=3447455 RepID=UPI003EE36DAB
MSVYAEAEAAPAGLKDRILGLLRLRPANYQKMGPELSPSALSSEELTTAVLFAVCLHVLFSAPWWLDITPEPQERVFRVRLAPPAKVIAPRHPLGTRNRTERLEGEVLPPIDQAAMDELRANQGNRINACTRCTLTGGDFSGGMYRVSNLKGADMRAANLSDADFSAARLIGANLAQADLRRTRLQGALLQRADFRLADLTNANMMGVWIDGADFTGANLTGAKMTEIDIAENVRFRDAILHDVRLNRSNVGGMDFYRADLSGADLRSTNGLTQVQLDYACGDRHTQLPKGFTIPECEG